MVNSDAQKGTDDSIVSHEEVFSHILRHLNICRSFLFLSYSLC